MVFQVFVCAVFRTFSSSNNIDKETYAFNLLVFIINIESKSFPLSDLKHGLVVEPGGYASSCMTLAGKKMKIDAKHCKMFTSRYEYCRLRMTYVW